MERANDQSMRDYKHGRGGGGVQGIVQVVGKEEHEYEINGKERSTAQSYATFSLEKETEEPSPLSFLNSHLLYMTGLQQGCLSVRSWDLFGMSS